MATKLDVYAIITKWVIMYDVTVESVTQSCRSLYSHNPLPMSHILCASCWKVKLTSGEVKKYNLPVFAFIPYYRVFSWETLFKYKFYSCWLNPTGALIHDLTHARHYTTDAVSTVRYLMFFFFLLPHTDYLSCQSFHLEGTELDIYVFIQVIGTRYGSLLKYNCSCTED